MKYSRKVNFGIPKLEVLHQNDESIIIKNKIKPKNVLPESPIKIFAGDQL